MPRYSKEFIAEIKSRLSVSEIVGKFVKLTQRGNEYIGLSPFKNEKTPSFTVNDEKEFYHCFSSAEHGDIFSFLMKHKNMTYPESIEYLAKQAGMDVEQGKIRNPNYVEKDYSSLKKIMNECNKFYQSLFKESSIAKKYVYERSLDPKIINKFEIGYSGNKSSQLYNFFKENGLNIEEARSLGLIKKSKNQNGEFYDFFRNRLMFPIKDYNSNVIAFGGRALDNSNIKYINSSDSPIFKKSYQLFNINLATEDNRKVKDLIIVEGYMDVISLYQNNLHTSVAPLGTALTAFQLEKAWRVCENPIIMFDGDEAGQKAAERAAMLALGHVSPDLSLRFCILPKDYDPDDFLKRYNSVELKKLLDQSISLSDFIWKKEIEKENISTPEKKAGFEKRIRQILSKISNQSIREFYYKYFNDKLFDLKRSNKTFSSKSHGHVKNKISREVTASERVNDKNHTSIIREKIIILCLIENPFLILKYVEDLGKIRLNDLKHSFLVSKILEFCSSIGDKELEKFDLKSYLLERGLEQEINYIYQSKLLNTYSLILKNDRESVEKSFLELINLQSNLVDESDLSSALKDLEKEMNDENFEKFLRIKNESLNRN